MAALEEFKIQREDYVLQMATLREQIAQQEADHKEEIYRLERKQVVDKDRCVASSSARSKSQYSCTLGIIYLLSDASLSCSECIIRVLQF